MCMGFFFCLFLFLQVSCNRSVSQASCAVLFALAQWLWGCHTWFPWDGSRCFAAPWRALHHKEPNAAEKLVPLALPLGRRSFRLGLAVPGPATLLGLEKIDVTPVTSAQTGTVLPAASEPMSCLA